MRWLPSFRRSGTIPCVPRNPSRTHPRPPAASLPAVRFLALHEEDAAAPFRWERHQHREFELILLERGPYRARIGDDGVRLEAGDALVVAPGDWHEDEIGRGARYAALNLSLGEPGLPGPAAFAPGGRAGLRLAAGAAAGLAGILAGLRRDAAESGPLAAAALDAATGEVFWRCLRALPEGALQPPFVEGDPFALRLRQLFQAHLRQPADVARLAAEAGMSTRSFDRACRTALGLPPAKALLHHRLEVAAGLLRGTSTYVQRIAAELGFANPFHFSRAFKRRYGQAPAGYRDAPPAG
jgi:AraC family transcriptional activator of pobA